MDRRSFRCHWSSSVLLENLDSPVVNEKAVVASQSTPSLDECHGYSASVVETTSTGLTVQLHLYGDGCHVCGPGLQTLLLIVANEAGGLPFHSLVLHSIGDEFNMIPSGSRIHVKIEDPEGIPIKYPNPSSLAQEH